MGSVRELIRQGIGRFAMGDARGARAVFEAAVAADPRSADALNGRGNVRLALGDAAGAIADYTRAIELAPDETKPYANRAQARLVARDWSGAVDDADTVLMRRGHDAGGYHTRAYAQLGRGRYAEARADFERFAALAPSDRRVRETTRIVKWLGDRERAAKLRDQARACVTRRDAAGALAALERAEAVAGANAESAELAAAAHALRGDLASARDAYGRALALDRDRTDAWFGRAACAHALMDLDAARSDYEMFVALAGTDPRVPKVRAILKELTQTVEVP